MSLSDLPLSYCTNVHPGTSVAEVEQGLDWYAAPVRQLLRTPLAAGLWLADPVVREILESKNALERFAEDLAARSLSCHTLNAFPFGNFHSVRVKENVYLPDWSQPARLTYTRQCATVLAALLPPGVDGSISTLPLGFKGFEHAPDFSLRCAGQLIQCAKDLAAISEQTGRLIRLAIEPEPMCVLETTTEAIEFFALLWREADRRGALAAVRAHVGVCYDVCHQAVEFEDAGESIAALAAAGVRINKVHLSSALQLDRPGSNGAGMAALRSYVEPRYLHQTIARSAQGRVLRQSDLTDRFLADPGGQFLAAPSWRIHFHVPISADRLGPLLTTRAALTDAILAVAALDYAPHLEVETYTWTVLPGAQPADLVQGLTAELLSAEALLGRTRGAPVGG